MLIKLYGWEIREALENYINKRVGKELEFTDDPTLTYTERLPIYERYKNGVIKRNKHGAYIVKEWKNEKRYADIHEDVDIDIWLS